MDRNKSINNKTSLGLLIKNYFSLGIIKNFPLSKTKTTLTSGFEFSNGEKFMCLQLCQALAWL